MPVVINEFEVVDTPPPAAPGPGTTASPAAPPRVPDEADLHRLLAEMSERALRVWSH